MHSTHHLYQECIKSDQYVPRYGSVRTEKTDDAKDNPLTPGRRQHRTLNTIEERRSI